MGTPIVAFWPSRRCTTQNSSSAERSSTCGIPGNPPAASKTRAEPGVSSKVGVPNTSSTANFMPLERRTHSPKRRSSVLPTAVCSMGRTSGWECGSDGVLTHDRCAARGAVHL
eukprot:3309386-Prymnesium_polylepis.2